MGDSICRIFYVNSGRKAHHSSAGGDQLSYSANVARYMYDSQNISPSGNARPSIGKPFRAALFYYDKRITVFDVPKNNGRSPNTSLYLNHSYKHVWSLP